MTRLSDVYLHHNDCTLYALDSGPPGSGTPLLFFHGGLADHRAALGLVGPLSARLRLITPDARGAGRSRWTGALSWEQLADDASALIRHLGLRRVVVGGSSMGSAIALGAALRHPEQVAGLLLVHPVYPGTAQGLAEAPRVAMETLEALGRRGETEGISVFYPLFDMLPEAIRARARAMLDSFDPHSVAATTRFLGSGAQPFDRLEELGELRCPVLVVPGRDPQHPAEVAEVIAGAMPQAEIVWAEGEELLERVAGFCERDAE